MAPRSRTNSVTRYKGYAENDAGKIGDWSPVYDRASCSDQTGQGDCAPFDMTYYTTSGGVIDKPRYSWYDSGFYHYYADYLDNISNAIFDLGLNSPTPPSNAAAATQGVMRTNPSRPYVDVPVEVLQLHEVAKLIRKRGNSLIRELSNEHLRYQFGIKPVVEDVVKLFQFSDQVDRRVKEIEKLKSEKGLRRTVDIGTYSSTSRIQRTVQSNYTYIDVMFDAKTTQTLRVHTRWLPGGNTASLGTPDTIRALAKRAVLGLTVDFSTVWELIPWSWLIDWCVNIGDYLKANRNIIPATLLGVHVMRHTVTEWSCPSVSFTKSNGSPVTMTPMYLMKETKTRQPSAVSLDAQFPFLSGSQLGIAAALVGKYL